ncbi:MAG: hypothetical protein ACR2OB_09380 [Solirubrobacteraceae bacterium]
MREERTKRWEARFAIPLMIAALATIPLLVLEQNHPHHALKTLVSVGDLVIWFAFAGEMVVVLAVAESSPRASFSGRLANALVILLFAAVVGGCGSQSDKTTGAPTSTAAAPVSSGHSTRTAGARAPARHRSGATGCGAPANVLDGVYHPQRLQILSACREVAGTVARLRLEPDGDVHVDLIVDPRYTHLLNDVNRASQGSALVVELMARDAGHLPMPAFGDRLVLTGAWVNDSEHGWNELHPVWTERINGGMTSRSGPQYGGSRAPDRSYDAAADCRTERGAPCQGYGALPAKGNSGGYAPSAGGSGSSNAGAGGGLRLRGGEFCTPSKEPTYEAAGYTCTGSSEGRNRLHRR